MTDKSAAELEREAERVRAHMAETAETLRNKLTPGQVIDEMMGYFKDSDSSLALHNLKTQARDNPMALAMIGSGIAWLMMGRGTAHANGHARSHVRTDPTLYRSGLGRDGDAYPNGLAADDRTGDLFPLEESDLGYDDDLPDRPGLGRNGNGNGDHSKSTLSSMSDKASDMASSASDYGSRMASGASEYGSRMASAAGSYGRSAKRGLRGAGSQMSHAGHRLADGTSHMAGRASRTFADALEREPLIVGALGLAIGAAIGALLPSSRTEDEYMGDMRDRMKDRAADAMNQAVTGAKDVANAAYSAARDASKEEGLVPEGHGKTLAEKVGHVAQAAAEAAEDSARKKVSTASDGSTSPASSTGRSSTGGSSSGLGSSSDKSSTSGSGSSFSDKSSTSGSGSSFSDKSSSSGSGSSLSDKSSSSSSGSSFADKSSTSGSGSGLSDKSSGSSSAGSTSSFDPEKRNNPI